MNGRHPCAWADANPDRYPEAVRYCIAWHGCEGRPCERKKYAQAQAKRAGAGYRKFPGAPFANNPGGECKWCDDCIEDPNKPGKISRRRGWHPECLEQFYLHTRPDSQHDFLVERDGRVCKECGAAPGKWVHDRWPTRVGGSSDVYVGSFTAVRRAWALEVDHVVALGLVAHLPVDERRPWFGPPNLQLLCSDCHRIKTRQDVAKIKAARIERNAA